VILAHIAFQSRRLARVEAAIAYVGVFSYGLYLIHQPYVIYLGERMRWMTLYEFVAAACPIIALLAVFCAQLERFVNRIVNFALKDKASEKARGVVEMRVEISISLGPSLEQAPQLVLHARLDGRVKFNSQRKRTVTRSD